MARNASEDIHRDSVGEQRNIMGYVILTHFDGLHAKIYVTHDVPTTNSFRIALTLKSNFRSIKILITLPVFLFRIRGEKEPKIISVLK